MVSWVNPFNSHWPKVLLLYKLLFLGYSGADVRAFDHSDKTPFMLAVEKGHLRVAKLMTNREPSLVSLQLGSGETVIHWALERGLDAFFKVCLLF